MKFTGCKYMNPDMTELYIVVRSDKPFCCAQHLDEAIAVALKSKTMATADELIGLLTGTTPEKVRQIVNDNDPRKH